MSLWPSRNDGVPEGAPRFICLPGVHPIYSQFEPFAGRTRSRLNRRTGSVTWLSTISSSSARDQRA